MKKSLEGGKLFFSVERFDYTKGILEKLEAYERYLKNHPDRIGKDVFYQLAPLNRQKIHTYSRYQNDCRGLVWKINKKYEEDYEREDGQIIKKGYVPVDIRTDGMKREELVLRYMAMDIGIVTPVKDGMNLVAKEMILSNPKAALILSEGAGTHHQFSENRLGGEYHLVTDITKKNEFADVMHEAVTNPKNCERLNEYLGKNDVDKWGADFLNGTD